MTFLQKKYDFFITIAILLGIINLSYSFNIDSLLEPDHSLDTNAQVCNLSPELFAQIQKPNPGSTRKFVLISENLSRDFAIRSAQILSASGFKVCLFPSTIPVEGDVTIVDEQGRSIIFYGRRQAEALFYFVQKHDAMLSSVNAFQTITNKIEKKALDSIVEPKVVGYFPDIASPAWTLFQQVATQISAQMPVFVTHDAHMAAKFRLTAANQIVIIRRLEKSYIHFDLESLTPGLTITTAQVIDWINRNRGLVIHELDDLNLYNPEVRDMTKFVFAAIGDKTSPFGIYFHKALMKTIRNITKENQILETMALQQQTFETVPQTPLSSPILLDDIEIVWIDTTKFPSALKKFSDHFQLSTTVIGSRVGQSLQFGLIQLPIGASVPVGLSQWFDVSQLFPSPNAIQQKFDEHVSISILKNWLLSITNRLPAPVIVSESELPIQDFVLEPEPVTVQQGASFILNCKTVNKQGKCQWQKDGVVISISANGHYRLVNAEDPEDCSLSVAAAQPARDQGSWSCHVTGVVIGQSTIEAISSNPAEVLVTPTTVKPKVIRKNRTKDKGNNKGGKDFDKKSKSSRKKSEL